MTALPGDVETALNEYRAAAAVAGKSVRRGVVERLYAARAALEAAIAIAIAAARGDGIEECCRVLCDECRRGERPAERDEHGFIHTLERRTNGRTYVACGADDVRLALAAEPAGEKCHSCLRERGAPKRVPYLTGGYGPCPDPFHERPA